MPPYADPGSAHEDVETTPESCIAELSNRLENITADAEPHQDASFPHHLFDAVLQTEVPFDSHHIRHLLPAIDTYGERIHEIFHSDSVLLLAYILLKSCDTTQQDTGLYFLLDRSRHNTKAHIKHSQGKSLLPGLHVSSILYQLVTALYTIFLDKDRDMQCRRLVGKALIESMVELESAGVDSTPQSQGYCPRITSILFHEADIVLRFFAFAIIRVLHTTGTNDDPIWMNCEPVYRTVYLKCLQEFPGDFIQSFHLYIAELEYYESRSTRSKSKKDGRSVHNKASSCHLIQSIAFGSQIHAENTILASSSPKNLTFILPAKGEVPGHFQYIEIPVHHILQLTQYTEGTLGLSLDTIGPIMMDGKERLLHESTAYMTADSDLQDLCTAIRGNGHKIRKGQIIRRTSATVVTLDTWEEVARKSIQHREKLSHASDHQSDLSEVELHESNDQKQPEPAVYEQNEPHVGPKLAQKASSLNESLLLTSQIAAIPTNTPSKASGLQSPEGEPILEQRNENILVPGDDLSSPVSYKGTPKDTIHNEHQEPNVLTSQIESTMRSADDGTGPRTTGLVTQNPQRRISRKRNGRMSSQKGPGRRSTRRRVSTNRNDRLNLPDTQESLLFPRSRRSNKKVYTSNSKAAVDWEEDLRPTEDDEEPETNIPQDIEVTSVSSPVPDDTSIFNKNFTTKPKRKARVTSSSIKGKKRTQRRKAATNKRKKTDRLPLQTKTSNSSNTIHETAIGHEAKDAKDTENENTYVPTETMNTSSLVPAGDASAITPTPYQSPLKCGPAKALQGDCEVATVKDGEQESTPRSNRNGWQMMTNSTPQKQYLGSKVQDSSDKATARSKRISESTAPADEQGSSMSCALAQESQAPDIRSYKRQYPEGANSLRPQHDELGLNSESAKDRTTGIEAQAMMTRSGFQQSELEQGSPVSKSGKRTVTQDCMGEGQNKKSSTAVASMLDKKNTDQSVNATTVKLGQEERSENDSFSRETSAAMKGCPVIPAGKRPKSPSMSPQSRSSASDRASELSTIHMSGQGRPVYSNFLSSTSPKKSIVDDNGSPRLVSRRFNDNTPLDWRGSRRLRFERDLYPPGEASSQSGYHGDSDYVDFTTPSLSDTSSISKRSWSRSASTSNSDANEIEETSYPNKRRCIPVTEKLRRAKGSNEQPIKAMITPFSLTASPQKEKPALDTEYNRGMKAPHPESQPSPSIASVFLEQELAQLSKRIEGSQSQASWQASLEAIQKALHDMLLNTSERLTRQLRDEKDKIEQVLDSYRQGCHRVLDQLFKTHEERIDLYRQQMTLVREQHKDLCQDLIRQFEENDRRIEERLRMGPSSDY